MLKRSCETLFITACLATGATLEARAQQGFPAWLGLYEPEQLGWLENENRIDELCADSPELDACYAEALGPRVDVYALHTEPDSSSLQIGDLVVVAVPGRGLTAHFRILGATTGKPFRPDLFLQDWGYGPYFHQTIARREGAWFRLPPDPWEAPVWLYRRDARAQSVVLYVQAGDIVELQGSGMYVVEADGDGLLLRSEQPADLWCEGGEPPPLIPDEPTRYSRSELVDSRGHLVVRPKYLKGC